jgi:hypothetical protein
MQAVYDWNTELHTMYEPTECTKHTGQEQLPHHIIAPSWGAREAQISTGCYMLIHLSVRTLHATALEGTTAQQLSNAGLSHHITVTG